MDIILASGSPRRRELLERMGLRDFRVVTPDIDERSDRPLPPHRLVETISAEKARAVAAQLGGDALIIAADTVVALDGAVQAGGRRRRGGDAHRPGRAAP